MANSNINASIARGSFTITPDDNNDLPKKAYGIYTGTGGDLHFLGLDGEEDTVTLAAGERWPVVIVRVYEDSTADELHGFVLFT